MLAVVAVCKARHGILDLDEGERVSLKLDANVECSAKQHPDLMDHINLC